MVTILVISLLLIGMRRWVYGIWVYVDTIFVLDMCGKYCQYPILSFSVWCAIFQVTISASISLNTLFPRMMWSLDALMHSRLEVWREEHSHHSLSPKTHGNWYVITSVLVFLGGLILRHGFSSFPEATCGIKLQMSTVTVSLIMHPLFYTFHFRLV